jgi:hypothetical protein
MIKEELYYKLTGTEEPNFITEREETIISKCLDIINSLSNDKTENFDLTKVSMNLNNRSIENVEKLSKLLREPIKARVVSTSLEITKNILEYFADGKEIIIRSADGTEKVLLLHR